MHAPGEKTRISAAGGFVEYGRVNGNLALSRALGDFEFKKSPELAPEQQIVTAYPDVTIHDLAEDDEFVITACDGKIMGSPDALAMHFLDRANCSKVSGTASLRKPLRSLCAAGLQLDKAWTRFVRT